MSSRFIHTIILFLVILVVSLGTSLAGSPVCPPGCPDCGVVPACCAEMTDKLGPETGGTADHLPGRSGCSHDGICLNGFQPIDVSAASGTFEYDSALVLSPLSHETHPNPFCRVAVPVVLKSPLETFPPIYLRNCSFLI